MTTAEEIKTTPNHEPLYYCGDGPRYRGDRVGFDRCDKPRDEVRYRVRVKMGKNAPLHQAITGYVLERDSINDIILYGSELKTLLPMLPDAEEPARIAEAQRTYDRLLLIEVLKRFEHETGGARGPDNTSREQMRELLESGNPEALAARKYVLETTALSPSACFWDLFRRSEAVFESIETIEELPPPETVDTAQRRTMTEALAVAAAQHQQAGGKQQLTPEFVEAMATAMAKAFAAAGIGGKEGKR